MQGSQNSAQQHYNTNQTAKYIIILIITNIIIIIIKQLVKQHMSVKNKLMNCSCGQATAVSDGKIC